MVFMSVWEHLMTITYRSPRNLTAGTKTLVVSVAAHLVGMYVHGTRTVCPVLQPSGESRIEVLDIDVHAWRVSIMAENLAATRLGLELEQPPEGARLVSEPSVFPTGLVFVKEVVMLLTHYSSLAPG